MRVDAKHVLVWLVVGSLAVADEPRPLAPLPDRNGVASPFAGVAGGALVVAGGANFPGKKPWEGGTKVWHDAVYLLDRPDGAWKVAGKLPRPLAYGISATHRDRVICVGGSDKAGHYADAFTIRRTDDSVELAPFASLPRPVANACGAIVGTTLYVVGGQATPDAVEALRSVFAIDLNAAKPTWREVEPIPGPGRILAVAASFDGRLWVVGGASLRPGPDGKAVRTYLTDGYRYEPGRGWSAIAPAPRPVTAAPSPAMSDSGGFSILGGDDGAQVGAPPDTHRGFRSDILRYDREADAWSVVGKIKAPRVTVPSVVWLGRTIIPSGESRPGIRSPEVWSFPTR